MERIAMLKEYLQATPQDNFLQHALALELIKTGDDAGARSLFESILELAERVLCERRWQKIKESLSEGVLVT